MNLKMFWSGDLLGKWGQHQQRGALSIVGRLRNIRFDEPMNQAVFAPKQTDLFYAKSAAGHLACCSSPFFGDYSTPFFHGPWLSRWESFAVGKLWESFGWSSASSWEWFYACMLWNAQVLSTHTHTHIFWYQRHFHWQTCFSKVTPY